MLKKNLSIILVILLTLLLVAIVIWVFNIRMQNMEKSKSFGTYQSIFPETEEQYLLIQTFLR